MFVSFVPTSANVVVTNADSIMLNIASDVPRRVEYVPKNADAWRPDKCLIFHQFSHLKPGKGKLINCHEQWQLPLVNLPQLFPPFYQFVALCVFLSAPRHMPHKPSVEVS